MDINPLRVLSLLAAAEEPSRSAAEPRDPPKDGSVTSPSANMVLPPDSPPPATALTPLTSSAAPRSEESPPAPGSPPHANAAPPASAAPPVSTTGAPWPVARALPPGTPPLDGTAQVSETDARLSMRVKYLNRLVRVRREMTALVRLRAATAPERAVRLPAPLPEGAAYTLDGIAASLFAIRRAASKSATKRPSTSLTPGI